jgi:hypothetical protein
MKKTLFFIVAVFSATAFCTPLWAKSHNKSQWPVLHHDAARHYKGKDHMFRVKNHHNYNPHYRKCGHMPSGSC